MIPAPAAHGGDGERIARALGLDPATILDLSMTLNPLAPDVATIAARHLESLRRYPEPDAATAERLLAEPLNADPTHVVVTNGGAEAIALVASEVGGRVIAEPEFGLYPREPTGRIWRSNPGNPIGLLAADDETAGVWDEAFYPVATGRWTRGDTRQGSIIVGSLTKTFACPGLRLGYVVAPDPDLATRIRSRRPTWSVNNLALAVLPELVAAAADLPTWAAQLATWRNDVAHTLRDHGFEPEPSDAPWLLVKAPGLRDRLAPHGIVVRDCTSFGLPDHVRIAVPKPDGLARLAAAL